MICAACGSPSGGPAGLPEAGPDARIALGCPSWPDPIASHDQTAPETYENFARPLLDQYCVRCHSSELMGDDRNGAPEGRNWDDESIVYDFLPEIRIAIGVENFMPPDAPLPSCEERLRFLRWIDVGAPR